MKKIVIALSALMISVASMAQVPVWVLGQWKFENQVFEFSEAKVYLSEGGKTIDEGTYEVDNSFIFIDWKNGCGDEELSIGSNRSLAISGGPFMNKISDKYRTEGPDLLKGYDWLLGKWVTASYMKTKDEEYYNCAIFTRSYYQFTSAILEGEIVTDLSGNDKLTFKITVSENEFAKGAKTICEEYYIDEASKSIYWLYDFDQKMYMVKVE